LDIASRPNRSQVIYDLQSDIHVERFDMPEDATSGAARANAGERIALGPGSQLTFKAVGADTGGAYAALEYLAAPGAGAAPHSHSREEESFYIIEGTLTFQLGTDIVKAEPGDFVRIPAGLRHAFANEGIAPVRALIVLVPAGLEQFFVDLDELLARSPDTGSPPEVIEALNRSYGLDFG
jgi:mannose-6-phosphate isomerase-like protein (cupin superfamily)